VKIVKTNIGKEFLRPVWALPTVKRLSINLTNAFLMKRFILSRRQKMEQQFEESYFFVGAEF